MTTEDDDIDADLAFHAAALGGDDLVPRARKIAPQPRTPMTPEGTALLRDMAAKIGGDRTRPKSLAELVGPAFERFNRPPRPINTDDR